MNEMQIFGSWSPGGAADTRGFNFADQGLCLGYGPGISVHQHEGRLLLVDGQFFDVSAAEAIVSPEKLDTAYGYFAYVLYDKITAEVTIGTDRFGYFPIYYAIEDGCMHFGSSMSFVKSKLRKRSVDYEAWEELLVLNEVIGSKSTIKQIKRLDPGTRVQIRYGKITFPVYWKPEVLEPMEEGDYIRENNRLLCEAMALTAASPARKVVLLSGGEDSRRLALAAVEEGLPVDFFTQESVYRGSYKVGVDRDVKIAAKVADLLGRPHHTEPMPDDAHFLEYWKARDLTLGFECVSHEWLTPLAKKIDPGALIYDGIVGDITINGHYFKALPRAVEEFSDVDALSGMICGTQRSPWLDELRTRLESTLTDRVKALLSLYPDSPHRLSYFYILNHTRRKISGASQLFRNYGHATCYPYMYYPLFMQSLRIDSRNLLTKFYQRECMRAMRPAILGVPTTRGALSAQWVITKGNKEQEQADVLLRNLEISDQALEVFPEFRRRYRVLRATKNISMVPLRRFGWFIPIISRFSSFLEWMNAD